MDIEFKPATTQEVEPNSKEARDSKIPAVDVKQTLSLRHQTALDWVMPEYWEPMHNG